MLVGGGAPAILGFEVEETVERSSHGNSHWGLALGPGGRLDGLGALFEALAAEGPETRVVSLVDLDDLLGRGFVATGRLLIDADATDAEDVGFVRRFLERQPGWELVSFGADAGRSTARRLAALPRARFLPWPPDLDQLRALARARRGAPGDDVHPAAAGAPGAGVGLDALLSGAPPARSRGVGPRDASRARSAAAARAAGAGPLRLVPSGAPAAAAGKASVGAAAGAERLGPRGRERFDLDGVLEETLAVLALRHPNGPRVRYRPAGGDDGALVQGDRGALAAALETLLVLARASGSADDVVRLQTARAPGGEVALSIEFPRDERLASGPLDLDALEQLDLTWAALEPGRLTRARELLEGQEGALALDGGEPDALAFACRLPAADEPDAREGPDRDAGRAEHGDPVDAGEGLTGPEREAFS